MPTTYKLAWVPDHDACTIPHQSMRKYFFFLKEPGFESVTVYSSMECDVCGSKLIARWTSPPPDVDDPLWMEAYNQKLANDLNECLECSAAWTVY